LRVPLVYTVPVVLVCLAGHQYSSPGQHTTGQERNNDQGRGNNAAGKSVGAARKITIPREALEAEPLGTGSRTDK
jgi:hypothetical protein